MPQPIVDSVLELIGATPIVRLRKLPSSGSAEVLVKLEAFNPAGSVKDRAALAMIEAAEASGALKPGATIVEPTSGNTGIGLAMVAAVKGYRLVLTMPDDASSVRRSLLRHYGATVMLTPASKLMQGAIDRAKELVAADPDTVMLQQFENEANPEAHRRTTAQEILEAVDGRLDAFVAGVGTGGTLTGVGTAIAESISGVAIVAVEPERSQALAGKAVQRHGIEGIGAGFVPPILEQSLVSRVLACSDTDALSTSVALASDEGISSGLSGGAAVWAALAVAAEIGSGGRVLAVIPDAWDRYADTGSSPQPRGASRV